MRTLHSVGSMLIALALLCVAAAPVTVAEPAHTAATAAPSLWIVQAESVAAARRSLARVNARAERELDIIHAVSAHLNPWQLEHRFLRPAGPHPRGRIKTPSLPRACG